jgi:AcrR family transcriptional regulator
MKKLGRKEREYRERRSAVLRAAELIFSKKGFHKSTMAEIAQIAEFATGTLYNFFKNKADLYITVIEEKSEELFQFIGREITNVRGTLEERITSLIKAHLSFFEKNSNFFKIFLTQRAAFEGVARDEIGEKLHKIYLKYVDMVTDIIEGGIKQGELKGLNPREASYALLGMLNSIITYWLTSGKKKGSLTPKAPALVEIFFKGATNSSSSSQPV